MVSQNISPTIPDEIVLGMSPVVPLKITAKIPPGFPSGFPQESSLVVHLGIPAMISSTKSLKIFKDSLGIHPVTTLRKSY